MYVIQVSLYDSTSIPFNLFTNIFKDIEFLTCGEILFHNFGPRTLISFSP